MVGHSFFHSNRQLRQTSTHKNLVRILTQSILTWVPPEAEREKSQGSSVSVRSIVQGSRGDGKEETGRTNPRVVHF